MQCWKVTQQFPTETIQFCTTLKKGGGETSNEDFKSAKPSQQFCLGLYESRKSALNAYNSRGI